MSVYNAKVCVIPSLRLRGRGLGEGRVIGPKARRLGQISNLKEDGMPQSRGTMFDDFSQLMTDAAEMAHGVRREAETMFKAQVERLLVSMDLVTREEFEAVARHGDCGARRERPAGQAHRGARGEARLSSQTQPSASGNDPAF